MHVNLIEYQVLVIPSGLIVPLLHSDKLPSDWPRRCVTHQGLLRVLHHCRWVSVAELIQEKNNSKHKFYCANLHSSDLVVREQLLLEGAGQVP